MADRNEHMFRHPLADGLKLFDETSRKLEVERHRADAQARHAEAYRQMPADLRQQADTWGVKALMEAVWLNGWDCGYRQSVRDRADCDGTPSPQSRAETKQQ